jgi:hypothetical protein
MRDDPDHQISTDPVVAFCVGASSALDLSGTFVMRGGREICRRSAAEALAGDTAAVGADFRFVFHASKLDDPHQEGLFDPDALDVAASPDSR